MKLSDLKNSRFLTKEDCDPPKLLTISHVTQENVAPPDQAVERKWCLHFKEGDAKPLVLNIINGQAIASITGSDDSDNWTGVQVVAYHDPNVSFGGKLVGGVRLRASRNKSPANAITQPAPIAALVAAEPASEDVPW